ncbi:hypothetical protein KXW39_007867 [Aspergillus fumigatus]|nr:hypothetical protein KXX06_009685 [Aspergillus fumigatus]KAH1753459.1 hypothetical protein KXX56_008796 [Aspergillus fumigatus]KAH2069019.1 hypothetical protein KXX03_009546 [Aspergillus fumigatus]KAH3308845.1 hypothetical protein KXV87_005875 [Aspergillus fumigatus]KAH3444272.1 hypothetical protein KXW39_007867 [Aspergillus fumigatus]
MGASYPATTQNASKPAPASQGLEHDQSLEVVKDETSVKSVDDDADYPSGIRLFVICLSLCLAVFLTALDNTIIATAIPRITDQFNSQGDIGWYGSAYLLTQSSVQLLFGKAYSFMSVKWVFLLAIGIFELGSLVCGVAPTSTALIIGRAIAGLGSAGISSGAIVIVTYSVPLVKRPMYTGLIGAMYGIASVAGPLLGGAFTDKVTWRWCFYINLPIGGLAVVLIVIFLKPFKRQRVHADWKHNLRQLDFLGSAVFMPAIICILLALQFGGTVYPWSNWRLILLLVLFGVLIIAWLGIQYWKGDTATVPPRMLKQRSFAAASWFNFTLGSFFLVLIYYIPIWFQAVKGTSAVGSGIRNIPFILGLVLVSIISGIGVTAIGYFAPFMIACSVISAIGVGLMMTFKPTTPHEHWIGYQAMVGIGIGMGLQQPLIVVQTVLPLAEVPIGTAVMYFLQTFGGTVFVSVGQNVFANQLKTDLAQAVPDLDSGLVVNSGATNIQKIVPASDLPAVKIAYNHSLTRAFLVATIMAAMTLLGSGAVEWKNIKKAPPEPKTNVQPSTTDTEAGNKTEP